MEISRKKGMHIKLYTGGGMLAMCLKKEVCDSAIHNYNLRGYVEELINIVEIKSPSTASHCFRVSALALKIGKVFYLSSDDMEELFIASMLHDLGKILVNDKILNKPNKLTEEEYEIMKGHSQKGFKILRDIEGMSNISEIILHHHERYDGSGYPCGLKGRQIPFLSRIIAVADSFDAMISDRPYGRKMSVDEAIKELERNKNAQFDRNIISVFLYLVKSNKITY